MKERRRYVRRPESVPMSVQSETGDTRTYITRDVSDGGVFLFALTTEQFPVGTEVLIWPAHGIPGATPAIRGRVVRSSAQGMGVELTEPGFPY